MRCAQADMTPTEPIMYRGFCIEQDYSNQYRWFHPEHDGPEDLRIGGTCTTIEDSIEAIDDYYDGLIDRLGRTYEKPIYLDTPQTEFQMHQPEFRGRLYPKTNMYRLRLRFSDDWFRWWLHTGKEWSLCMGPLELTRELRYRT